MLGTNCYIAVNEATGHGVVVDPAETATGSLPRSKKKVSLLMRFLSHMVTATISWDAMRIVTMSAQIAGMMFRIITAVEPA